MRKTVITSFTEEYYNKSGKDFIRSFKEHWKGVDLVVYYEGENIRDDWHFIEEVEGLEEWFEAISYFPMMRGDMGDGTYNIQLDAGMVRKSLMLLHAAKTYGGKVFWIDADVFTFADVPEDFLDTVLPDDKFCCYLGRDQWNIWPNYTESGFLGFNTQHPLAENFFGAYQAVIKSGLIFTMESWHDCVAFDLTRKAFKGVEDEFVNLSEELPPTTHPFVNSVLGKYMDHKKGTRKSAKSRPEDFVVERNEDYWKKEEGPVIVKSSGEAWNGS